ncbi:hypothetical protein [Allokutzneria albata]|uniref:Peptidase inhibitor family I36 n=1 Tax=Allokutzneria albata TaxID=211114 RepID=A0A1G9RVE4_ALLAB|nr:hypothetical protein [Allokutzneria albata]SDM27229.1 hypothetical protein SAMN04489726_0715 [Allokutzneria albata]
MFKLSARSAGKRLAPIALAVALLGAAPAASARPANYDCPADALGCLFTGRDGTGDRYVVRDCGTLTALPSGWWDKIDSARVQAYQIILYSFKNDGSGDYHVPGVLRGGRGQNVNATEANTADIIDCWW